MRASIHPTSQTSLLLSGKIWHVPLWAQPSLYLLMEKQHNRGQDGVGVATVKFDVAPGKRYISRYRTNAKQPIQDTFDYIMNRFKDLEPEQLNDPVWLKENQAFTGELLLGHLRLRNIRKKQH